MDARLGGVGDPVLHPFDLLGAFGCKRAGEVVAGDNRGNQEAEVVGLLRHFLDVCAGVILVDVMR